MPEAEEAVQQMTVHEHLARAVADASKGNAADGLEFLDELIDMNIKQTQEFLADCEEEKRETERETRGYL